MVELYAKIKECEIVWGNKLFKVVDHRLSCEPGEVSMLLQCFSGLLRSDSDKESLPSAESISRRRRVRRR